MVAFLGGTKEEVRNEREQAESANDRLDEREMATTTRQKERKREETNGEGEKPEYPHDSLGIEDDEGDDKLDDDSTSQRIQNDEKHEEQNGRKINDRWMRKEGSLIREHRKLRRALFTPVDVKKIDDHLSDEPVGAIRVTEGEFTNGKRFRMEDDWTTLSNSHKVLAMRWTGRTTFRNYPIDDAKTS